MECRRVIGIVLLVLTLGVPSVVLAETLLITMPRDAAVDRLAGGIVLSEDLRNTLSQEDQERLLGRWRQEFRILAAQVLPDPVEAKSQATLDTILAGDFTMTESDDEFNRLVVEEWARFAKINLLLARESDETWLTLRHRLLDEFAALADAMQQSMIQELNGLIAPETVQEYMATERARFIGRIRDLTASKMGKPITERQRTAFLKQFNSELKTIAASEKQARQNAGGPDAGAVASASPVRDEKMLLFRATDYYFTSWEAVISRSPEIKSIPPETYDEQYPEVLKRRQRLGVARKATREAEAAIRQRDEAEEAEQRRHGFYRDMPPEEMLSENIASGTFDTPLPALESADVYDSDTSVAPNVTPAVMEVSGAPPARSAVPENPSTNVSRVNEVEEHGHVKWKALVIGATCFALAGAVVSRIMRRRRKQARD